MDYIESLFNKNFLEYASYVIRDRAIPDLEDGLKPVQRRILHSLFDYLLYHIIYFLSTLKFSFQNFQFFFNFFQIHYLQNLGYSSLTTL